MSIAINDATEGLLDARRSTMPSSVTHAVSWSLGLPGASTFHSVQGECATVSVPWREKGISALIKAPGLGLLPTLRSVYALCSASTLIKRSPGRSKIVDVDGYFDSTQRKASTPTSSPPLA